MFYYFNFFNLHTNKTATLTHWNYFLQSAWLLFTVTMANMSCSEVARFGAIVPVWKHVLLRPVRADWFFW